MLSDPKWGLDEIGRAMVKAADIIRDGGHCKFRLKDDNERHCFYGAAMVALGGVTMAMSPEQIQKQRNSFGEIARRVIRYKLWHTGGITSDYAAMAYCVDWNNHPSTTAEEVEQALREGAHCREDVLV
jgi:hypothetical protein